jgi:hypothetical protein
MEWAMRRWTTPAASIEKLQSHASDKATQDIAKDVPRTQPMHFEDAQVLCLQRVLQAYAGCNPDIGYCQGMNFMAAVFVNLGLSDAESLIGLSFLVEEICPGLHDADLGGFHRDMAVLEKLVQHFLPSVHEELADIGVPISLLAMDHFIALGSRNWPLVSVLRLWDVIFMEGSPAVFGSFLVLLEFYIPVGRCDRILTKVSPDDTSLVPDEIDSFKRDSSKGVVKQMDAIMRRVRTFVELISEAWVADLRESVGVR